MKKIRNLLLVGAAIVLPATTAIAQYTEERARTAENNLRQSLDDLTFNVADADRAGLQTSQEAWETYRDRHCDAQATLMTGPKSQTARIAKPLVMRDCRTRLTERRKTQLDSLLRSVIGYKEWRARYQDRFRARPSACRLANLPPDYEVVAIGARRGLRDTDHQLDLSGKVTKESDVIVDYPSKPVLLVLMSADPVIWNIKRTQQTQIAGVIAASHSKQAVLGIAKSVPLHIASKKVNRRCGIRVAYQGGPVLEKADKWVRKIAGRGIDQMVVLSKAGAFRVGNAEPVDRASLVASADYNLRDYTDLEPFPTGKRGIDQLLRKGLIRMASEEDIAAWRDLAGNQHERFQRQLDRVGTYSLVNRAYVVLGKVNLPNGLTGIHRAMFIVPQGTPMPGGAANRTNFLWMETGECTRGLRYKCR